MRSRTADSLNVCAISLTCMHRRRPNTSIRPRPPLQSASPQPEALEAPIAYVELFGSTLVICRSRCNISIGKGNTIVEFFSDAISVSV